MNNVFTLAAQGPRVEVIKQLQDALPACAKAAAEEIGLHGMRQFFDGYKDTVDLNRRAA